ncbi:MAG: hypothetical protein ACJ766_13960 [Thermoleophilaceae bacterium]
MGQRLITGRVVNSKEPDWRPLERLASPYLCSHWMWMFEVATRRGERFHAYKHIDTRCYVHIDIDGNGLAYHPDEDRYSRHPAWVLLRGALRPWWEELKASPEDIALAQIAISRAQRDDWGGDGMLAPERRRELAFALEGALLGGPDFDADEEEGAYG